MKRDPTAFLREEYEELRENNLDWRLRTLEGPSAPRTVVDGRPVIMLCSNNYLNLSNHPRIIEASVEATRKYGAGSGSVRPIAGNMEVHMEVEKKLAEFKKADAALVYQTGFATNSGLIPQLADKGDIIISDSLNHGSIIDGIRLCRADRGIYEHQDIGQLEDQLVESDKKGYRRILVITDGVFSMDGDVAKADEIAKLCDEFGAMSYIDDAHGEGVLGPHGEGISVHFGIEGKIDVEVGTFSKAYGVVGGLIAGSRDLVNYALNKSRTWLLSGSHPPGVAAAQLAALNVLDSEPEHHRNLWDNTKYFKKELQSMGFDTGDSVTPITPVMCGESSTAKAVSEGLYENGVFALPIVFPMVAQGKARIRTIMNAGLTREDLDDALRAFEKVGRSVSLI
ncbi:MAG TPA: aminotransferase class I/II-fold pyridoxal phosphate-dependent enzyme [Candidatus Methanofastidiosa archaeon]|nr:aminotransferase class I/II-fold pyridoxal phosphate-dependent enzyme [Candidatus Methanofastidiosa archaeon]